MRDINILVSVDKNYIFPLKVMMRSLVMNTKGNMIFYLLHSSIEKEYLDDLHRYCDQCNVQLYPIQVDKNLFENAPITKRYPQEMYYRLLSPHILPQHLNKILYLDPDILIINSVMPLWETDLEDNVFAAASHTGITDLVNGINRVRLGTDHDYFNSGIILMNLAKARELIIADDIFQYIEEHEKQLLLPDQDVFNALYGNKTLAIDDVLWNYDVRNYYNYYLRSAGKHDLDWVMENTSILHFCGKSKPWKSAYKYRFSALYKHYMNIVTR